MLSKSAGLLFIAVVFFCVEVSLAVPETDAARPYTAERATSDGAQTRAARRRRARTRRIRLSRRPTPQPETPPAPPQAVSPANSIQPTIRIINPAEDAPPPPRPTPTPGMRNP